MITTRIIDNDMGRVLKTALTGRGSVHGIIVQIEGTKLPEFEVGLLEILAADMSIPKFQDHVEEHLNNSEQESAFVESYRQFVTPINKSGRVRY